jgi:hypothetical protein
MKARGIVVTLVALVAIGVTSFFAYRYEQKRETPETCPFCDRMVHPITAYRLKVGDYLLAACCPRCGMHAEVNREHGKPGAGGIGLPPRSSQHAHLPFAL